MSEPVRVLPVEAAQKMAEGYAYLDVRSEQEFAQGHPDGAYNVPYLLPSPSGMTANPDFVTVVSATFDKNAKLVVGCKSGMRSLRAAKALLDEGFSEILEQRAGWDGARSPFGQIVEPGWSRTELPTASGEPEGRSYRALRGKAGLGS